MSVSLQFGVQFATLSFFKRGVAAVTSDFPLDVISKNFFDHGALWLTLVRDVKEKLCYLALDYDPELKSTAESSDKKQTHMLSDGNIFTVSAERFRCTSVFFQPISLALKPAESTTLLSTL